MLGWILIVICTLPGVWYLFSGESFPFHLSIEIPWPFTYENGLLDPQIIEGVISLDIIDEIIALGAIAGFFLVGFTKQLIEDERIAQLSLEALQWGFYASYLLLTLCVIFIHGSLFFMVIVYNMFTPLVIFVIRFYWLLYIRPVIEEKKERSLA